MKAYYTCIAEYKPFYKEHCVKGAWGIPEAIHLSVSPMPPMPFFLEKQIFELRFPNHILHPGLVVSPPPAKPKDEIY
jgi:hypothetical protein